jgi:HSP20 family protein
MFEGLFNAPTDSSRSPVRYNDKGEAYELRLELPGYSKTEVNAEIDNNLLIISVTPKEREEDGDDKVKKRSFQLPEGIDSSKSKAMLENGVLTVSLPKKAARKPLRIKIG